MDIRIYKSKYYLMQDVPGISGFKRWDEREYFVATGHHARNNRTKVIREFQPLYAAWFRLEDGHLPEYQPRVDQEKALKWLDENIYGRIHFILDTEKYYV